MELSVTVEKHRLPGIAAIKGLTNADAFESHPAGTLLFNGFIGRHVGQQRFEGILSFNVLGKPQEPSGDFGLLFEVPECYPAQDDEE